MRYSSFIGLFCVGLFLNSVADAQSHDTVTPDHAVCSVGFHSCCPLSCMTRAPCRRVIRAAGQRATAAR